MGIEPTDKGFADLFLSVFISLKRLRRWFFRRGFGQALVRLFRQVLIEVLPSRSPISIAGDVPTQAL